MGHEHLQQVVSGFHLVADEFDDPAVRGFVKSAKRLVELAELCYGQRVRDVGTGTGNAGIVAAQAVGPERWVAGVEIAKHMREKALQRIAAAGLRNVEVQAGDAASLPFANDCFALILCASAISTLTDIPAALREWRRVLKPGGRVAFSSLGEGNDRLSYDLLGKYGIPLPPEMPLQRVDTRQKCARFLQETGFEEKDTHIEQLGYDLRTAGSSWAMIWNTGARIPLQ